MPKYNWGEVSEASGAVGGYTVPNGGYIGVITAAKFGKSNAGNDQLVIQWDIAEGEYANIATRAQWYDSKHSDYISFSPSALRFSKAKLMRITESNANFDAIRAVDNDAFDSFVGKRFGMVLKCEYGEWQGKQTKKMRIVAYKSVADINAGNFVVPEDHKPADPEPVTVPRSYGSGSQQPWGSSSDESIPF
jgi:hypothetical protein